jgi:hypothetical protein
VHASGFEVACTFHSRDDGAFSGVILDPVFQEQRNFALKLLVDSLHTVRKRSAGRRSLDRFAGHSQVYHLKSPRNRIGDAE